MTRGPALSARIRSVALHKHPVLHDIALDIAPSRWSTIVGPNGAGKSTLLRALAGLQPCDGEVRSNGAPLSAWAPSARARHIAWLGQQESGADDLSAGDVVLLGRLPHRRWLAPNSSADHAAADRAMQRTHSAAWRERRFGSLSQGERQRVLLARALAVEANVLLMDEPLAHLDPPHQADWLQIVRELIAHGTTVVSVLHELAVALQSDILIVMHEGRIRHTGSPQDAVTRDALAAVFNHRLDFGQIDHRWIAMPRCEAPLRP